MSKPKKQPPRPKKRDAPTPLPPPVFVPEHDDDDDDDVTPPAPGDAEEQDIVRAANELSGGDSGARVHVQKLEPKDQRGTCLPYPASEFTLERLFDDYGGGTYQIRIHRSDGRIHKRSIETLVERREKPAAPVIDVSQIKRDAKAEYDQANAPVMALMTKAFDAMIGRGPAVQLDPADSLNKMLEGAERIAKIGNKSREGGSEIEHLAAVAKFVDALRDRGGDKEENSGIAIVRDLIGMVRDARPGLPASPGAPPRNGEGDGMNVFIRELFASYGGVFLRAAEAGSDPGVYAQLLCDQVPPKFYAVVAVQLNRPDWFDQLTAIDPRVLPHRVWIEELRTGFLQAIKALDTSAPAGAQPAAT